MKERENKQKLLNLVYLPENNISVMATSLMKMFSLDHTMKITFHLTPEKASIVSNKIHI